MQPLFRTWHDIPHAVAEGQGPQNSESLGSGRASQLHVSLTELLPCSDTGSSWAQEQIQRHQIWKIPGTWEEMLQVGPGAGHPQRQSREVSCDPGQAPHVK